MSWWSDAAWLPWVAVYGWPGPALPPLRGKLLCVGGPMDGQYFSSDCDRIQAHIPQKINYFDITAGEIPPTTEMPPITQYFKKMIKPCFDAQPVRFWIWEVMLGLENEPTDFALNHIMVNVFGAPAPKPKETA